MHSIQQPDEMSYDRIARYYDLEIASYTEDLDFFSNFAARTGGPVLDLGCGNGRVAAALARAGYDVVGLDESGAMLDIARRRLPTATAGRVRLLQADMRNFDLGSERFALALCAAGTFAHLTDAAAQVAALTAVRRHLLPQGIFLICAQNPCQWAADGSRNELVLGWEKPGPGVAERTRMTYSVRSDLALQLRQMSVWYDVTTSDGSLRRAGGEFTLRWTWQPEFELLLRLCKFLQDACYGSYDLEPYEEESPCLIVVARKA